MGEEAELKRLRDQSLRMATTEDLAKKAEMNDQLREYISQWRDERNKEEAELKRLKDKQAARKENRAEQEKKLAAAKRAEEEKIKRERKHSTDSASGFGRTTPYQYKYILGIADNFSSF